MLLHKMNDKTDNQIDPPLCVDLDGTLVKIDTLHQALLLLIRRNPKISFKLFSWMKKGRATFKNEVMKRVNLSENYLPYNEKLLKFLYSEKSKGRRLVLVTAANFRTAELVQNHLKIFDKILSSTPTYNLFGKAKKEKLLDEFKVFDYAGDSIHDKPIFEVARKSILVNPVGKARKIKADLSFDDRPSVFLSIIKSLRPYQWLKNILIFFPIFLAHRLSCIQDVVNGSIAFASFCLIASSVYVINDLLDLSADQSHPIKQKRPFACGDLQIITGLKIIPFLILASIAIGYYLEYSFLLIIFLYLILSIIYSLKIKSIIILDVVLLAIFYGLRIIAGSVSTGDNISVWFYSFAATLFLSLALVKRSSELAKLSTNEGKLLSQERGYNPKNFNKIVICSFISSICSLIILFGYILSTKASFLYSHPNYLFFTMPIIGYWLLRMCILSKKGKIDYDPLSFALKDFQTYIIGFLVLLIIYIAT